MLKRLYVDNVRSLSNFELSPEPVAALVGPNGGGKSTVFDILWALQTLLGPAAPIIGTLFPFVSRTRWTDRLDQVVELLVDSGEQGQFRYVLKIHHEAAGRDATLSEELSQADEVLYRFSGGLVQLYGDRVGATPRVEFPADPRRSFLPILEARADNQRIHAFKRWVGGLLLFRLKPDQIAIDTDSESEILDHHGRTFVSWYRTLQQEAPHITAKILDDMRPYIPGLMGIRLEKFGPSHRALTLDASISGRTVPFFLNELSDGQRTLLLLYSILRAAAHRATLLMFDEPDNFVAQEEIQPWLAEVRQQLVDAGRGTLLVISHHPEIIDYLAPDQVVRLWRDDGPTRVHSLDPDRAQGLQVSEALKLGLKLE